MKSLLKWSATLLLFAWLLVMLLVGARLAQLNPELVTLQFLAWQLPEMSLGMLVCVAFLAGVSLGLLAFAPSFLRVRWSLRRARKQLAKAQADRGPQVLPAAKP